jgi:tetratricopeptide (TPR) repeat protein
MMDHATPTNPDAALSATLAQAADQLGFAAEKTAASAGEILDAVPGQPQALLLLCSSMRLLGENDAAGEVLEWMAGKYPKLAAVHFELGLLLGRLGKREQAIEHLSRVVELEPRHPAAWRALGNQQVLQGDAAAAGKSFAEHARRAIREVELIEDTVRAGKDDLVKAENMLRQSLDINPTDAFQMRLLGEVYVELSRPYDARTWLARALDLAPGYQAARESYAEALNAGARWRDANAQYDILAEDSLRRAHFETLKAANLVLLGDYDEALALFEKVRPQRMNDPGFWVTLGHALRTVGRSDEAMEVYRKCVEISAGYGGGWIALANLKTYRFSRAEIEAMQAQAGREDLPDEHRTLIEFALGQALEDEKDYAGSFEHYRQANTLRRKLLQHDSAEMTAVVKRVKAFFTPELFRTFAGSGCKSPDPIFIVGMVRSGSTLVEQILASHSLVEGTMELPELNDVVTEQREGRWRELYPEMLGRLDDGALQAMGERYLEKTRYQRKLARPYFTDKSGGNFLHVGLLQLILPNAKIVDARRHPLGCSFSCFKQNFPIHSVPHTYDLAEMGSYYRNYVELMAHFDRVLPGKVHRVIYENMVSDTEGEIRRLLDFCGLPFEEQCLRYYETDRGVRTVSSEQVRKPISNKSVEAWQNYDQWLGPAREALGDVLTMYPKVPQFG